MDHEGHRVGRVRHQSRRVFPLNADTHPPFREGHRSYSELLAALRAVSEQHGGSLALLLVEVTGTSDLQARLGYEASEQVLRDLFDAFSDTLANRGSLLQLADGRFAMAIGGVRNAGHAVLAGEKLLRVADAVFARAELIVTPPLTVGVSLFPSHADELPTLVRHSQLALAAARSQASRLQVYDAAAARRVMASWELRDAFARALDAGELSVYFQPKIRTVDRCPCGVEALLRWLDGGKPVATPDIFVPLAEAAGLIHDATWYVLTNSLRLASECPGLQVSVNVTPGMLHHREFIDMIDSAIANWRIDRTLLTLEITEGALMADFGQAHARLTRLRETGVRISIDDFGTGYSSLSYFKSIPADELKIDKSFVLGMLKNASDRSLVETIINLARRFKLATVAEGVEDLATLEALATLGCDHAQGYLFSPAIDASSLKSWLTANRHAAIPVR